MTNLIETNHTERVILSATKTINILLKKGETFQSDNEKLREQVRTLQRENAELREQLLNQTTHIIIDDFVDKPALDQVPESNDEMPALESVSESGDEMPALEPVPESDDEVNADDEMPALEPALKKTEVVQNNDVSDHGKSTSTKNDTTIMERVFTYMMGYNAKNDRKN